MHGSCKTHIFVLTSCTLELYCKTWSSAIGWLGVALHSTRKLRSTGLSQSVVESEPEQSLPHLQFWCHPPSSGTIFSHVFKQLAFHNCGPLGAEYCQSQPVTGGSTPTFSQFPSLSELQEDGQDHLHRCVTICCSTGAGSTSETLIWSLLPVLHLT